MQHSMNTFNAKHERYNDLRRHAEALEGAVEPGGRRRRTFYSPALAWAARSLVAFGLRLHHKHGRRRFSLVIREGSA